MTDVLSSPGLELRDPTDTKATRSSIYNGVFNGLSKLAPVADARHQLSLTDLSWADPEGVTPGEHKKAILRNETLSRRLRGTWTLTDVGTGEVLDQKKSTVAAVPRLTDDGTFVINGVDYTLGHQSRLRSGVFVRRQHNGETTVHVNALPGKGVTQHYSFNPEKSLFKAEIGTRSVPILSILRGLGVPDDDIRSAWGDDIYRANAAAKPGDLQSLAEKVLRRKKPSDPGQQAAAVVKALSETELDPEVTQITLGHPTTKLDGPTILKATQKLLRVHQGKEDPDDRDAPVFQRVYGPDDLLAERAERAGEALRGHLWKIGFRRSLAALPAGALSKHLRDAITSSGVGVAAEEVNPLELLGQVTRITRMGVGGIPSADSIPDESRAVHPSQAGFIDPVMTSESLRVGVDLRLASAARKGNDGRLYSPVRNLKTGQVEYLSPRDLHHKKLLLPKESGQPYGMVIDQGRLDTIDPKEADYELPDMEGTLNPLMNLVPFRGNSKPHRILMGARMMTQALPLENGEAPLVRPIGEDGTSYHAKYGTWTGALRSDKPGQVVEASPGLIRVKHDDGTETRHELRENRPYNRKTSVHQSPAVQIGQRVEANGLLARSNFTDAEGNVAVGKNLYTAYLPYRAWNWEDAAVVSAAAAKKLLRSEHAYQHTAEFDNDVKIGRDSHGGLFPGVFNRQQTDQVDADGVVKVGSVVKSGDPLILRVRKRERAHNRLVRGSDAGWSDDSVTWDHDDEGVVTDVEKTDKGLVVAVKSFHGTREGDKVAGSYGDKGVLHIIPDEEMPRDSKGRPFEYLTNPMGLPTRTNPSQVAEAILGKIAAARGKPYFVKDFKSVPNLMQYVLQEAKLHGISPTDDVTDPQTGVVIPRVLTGMRHIMKLHHEAEGKGSGRGTGGYTQDDTPARGGEGGAKRLSLSDANALLSHGALEVYRDGRSVRGQRNLDYWASFLAGREPPEPAEPIVYDKMLNFFKAAGVNPVRNGSQTRLLPMTDDDVQHMAGDRELQNAETVDPRKGLEPIPGGLFDKGLTGGHGGRQMSKITLAEPLPSPVFEDALRRVLGVTQKKFEGVLAGREPFGQYGTGPGALKKAVDSIDLDKEVPALEKAWRSAGKTARDAIVKKWSLLKHARDVDIHPSRWFLNAVPVLPPVFRPISQMLSGKQLLVADPNYLYRDLFHANEALKTMTGRADVGDERLNLYRSLKAVTGLEDPQDRELKAKGVRGLLEHVFGKTGKSSMIQSKLLSGPADATGRAVITPGPHLDVDEIELPEKQAWKVFEMPLIRRLVRDGASPLAAADMVKRQDPTARKALEKEMQERPVQVTRAPILHRYNVLAFRARLGKSDSLRLPPLVYKGLGADNDGDAVSFHVPMSDSAVKESFEKMLPSKNLLSVRDFGPQLVPNNEFVAGLYKLSTDKSDRPPAVFRSIEDAVRAYQNGEISHDQEVRIPDRR